MAQHQGEQPDHPLRARFVGELGFEIGEIHLGLFARRRLKPALETPGRCRPHGPDKDLHQSVAALIALLFDFPVQASGR